MDGRRYSSERATTTLDERPWSGARGVEDTAGGAADSSVDEPKYPAWKVSLFVIVFCGAFWAGVSYLAIRLFG